jgi:putative addiction module component (TIGR02574 family)
MARPAFDIDRLTTEERLQLIEALWDSLGRRGRDALPLTTEQQEELGRRLDALDRAGPHGLSSEELFDRIRNRSS